MAGTLVLSPSGRLLVRWREGRDLQIEEVGGTVLFRCDWKDKPAVTALAVSPDDARVAVGCRMGALFVIEDGVMTSHDLGSTVQYLALEGGLVAAGLSSGRVVELDGQSYELGVVWALALRGGRLAVGLEEGAWVAGTPVKAAGKVVALAFGPPGLALGTSKGEVIFPDHSLVRGPGPVQALAFSPSGSRLAASFGAVTRVYCGGKVEFELPGCTSLAFASESLLRGVQGTVESWDLAARGARLRLPGDEDFRLLAFSPDENKVVGSCYKGLRVWDSAGRVVGEQRLEDEVLQVGFSPAGAAFALVSREAGVALWSGAEFQTGVPAYQACCSPDMAWLAAVELRCVHLFDLRTRKLAWTCPLENMGKPTALAFASGELALATDYGELARWRIDHARPRVEKLESRAGRDAELHKLAYTVDGRRLVALRHDSHYYDVGGLMTSHTLRSVMVWEAGRQTLEFKVGGWGLDVSPDGALFRVGSELYRLDTGHPLARLEVSPISGFAFSSRWMAICGESGDGEYATWLWPLELAGGVRADLEKL